MEIVPKFCGHCGKKLTAKEKKQAKEADLPFCPRCLPRIVGDMMKVLK